METSPSIKELMANIGAARTAEGHEHTAGDSTGKGGDEEKGEDTEDLTGETAPEVAITNFDKPGALLSDVQERQRSFLVFVLPCFPASEFL